MAKFRSLSRKRKIIYTEVFLILICAGSPAIIRTALYIGARNQIYARIAEVPKCRACIILGAKVKQNGTLSVILTDRVNKGIELYKAGKVEKLLMSGDNRFYHYNEPERMKEYAIAHGVPEKDIATDYAGRRTYDTLYRAKYIFGLNKFVVVSQRFHLDRTIFLAKHIGVTAYGVPADVRGHRNLKAEVREIPACMGALVDAYLRQPRPIMGKKENI